MNEILVVNTPDRVRGKLVYSDWAENPRDFDPMWKLITTSSCYVLGDNDLKVEYLHEIEEMIEGEEDKWELVEVYVYEHGSMCFQFSPTCRFDSGLWGFAALYLPDVVEKFGFDKVDRDQLRNILVQELNYYAAYINGDVYDYHIYVDDEIVCDEGNIGIYDAQAAQRDMIEAVFRNSRTLQILESIYQPPKLNEVDRCQYLLDRGDIEGAIPPEVYHAYEEILKEWRNT